MKKLLIIVLALAFLGGLVVPAYAAQLTDTKYCITNTTGTTKATAISTSMIRPGKDRILKITVCNSGLGASVSTENVVAIYDCTTVGATLNSVLEGEVEKNADSAELVYLKPLRIFNGVTILQGAFTAVTIEYERQTP